MENDDALAKRNRYRLIVKISGQVARGKYSSHDYYQNGRSTTPFRPVAAPSSAGLRRRIGCCARSRTAVHSSGLLLFVFVLVLVLSGVAGSVNQPGSDASELSHVDDAFDSGVVHGS